MISLCSLTYLPSYREPSNGHLYLPNSSSSTSKHSTVYLLALLLLSTIPSFPVHIPALSFPHILNTKIALTPSSIQHFCRPSHHNTLLKMRIHPDGICHQNLCQDGVCGCASFWQHTTPVLSPANIATESGIVEACTLPIRKRQRDTGLNAPSTEGSAAKRLRLDGCGEEVNVRTGTLGAETVETRTNEQKSGKRKKKGKKRKCQLKR